MTANTRACGPLGRVPMNGVHPARTPGPLGVNDHGDPTILALMGDTPGTSALFIQDAIGKRVLRLDYGFNKTSTTETQIDYHWNQKGTFGEFGIADHTPAGPAGEALYKAAKVFKYGGLVGGIAGYAGASWAAEATYDYVEELYYERLAPSAP